jgi:hypothetical protein
MLAEAKQFFSSALKGDDGRGHMIRNSAPSAERHPALKD